MTTTVVPTRLEKMRAELASLNHCAVSFLSRAAVNLSWYDSTSTCLTKITALQNEVALSYFRVHVLSTFSSRYFCGYSDVIARAGTESAGFTEIATHVVVCILLLHWKRDNVPHNKLHDG